MKKIFRYTLIVAALLQSFPTMAQTSGASDADVHSNGLEVSKTVTQDPDADGKYYITIDAFATGSQVSTIVETSKPADIVLALDFSSSLVRERLESYYKLPYDRALKYNDYTHKALNSPTNSGTKEEAEYYYLYNGTYYQIEREDHTSSTTTTYYYLRYTKNDVTYYLQPNGSSSTTMPTSVTTTGGTAYRGQLYKKVVSTAEPNCYYAYYENGGDKYYYITGTDNSVASTNLQGFTVDYESAHDAQNDVIFRGQLYTKSGKNKYSPSGDSSDSYTFSDLDGRTYYIKYGNGKNDYTQLGVGSPSGTHAGTVSETYEPDGAATKQWTYTGYGTTQDYFLDGGNYYQVTRGSYTPPVAGSGYGLYIKVGGQKLYLKDNGLAEAGTQYYVPNETDVIYTGDLYSNTRLVALQIAAGEFLDAIAEKTKGPDGTLGTDDDVENYVELVMFAQTVLTHNGLEKVTPANITKWKNAIYSCPAYQGTAHNLAMQEAATTLLAAQTADTGNERIQTLVFFTDGETYQSGTSNQSRVTDANTALGYANQLKQKNIPTYVVSLISQTVADNFKWVPYLLKWLSSNFAYNAAGYSIAPVSGTSTSTVNINLASCEYGEEVSDQYLLEYSESNNLSQIFQTISESIHTGEGSSIELSDKSLVAVDVMSSYFKLPDGVGNLNPADIKVYVQKCVGKDGDAYVFEKKTDGTDNLLPVPQNGVEIYDANTERVITTNIAPTVYTDGSKEVDVAGFDYSTLYCGMHGTDYDGYRLVFKIPIVIDPANPGGANLKTNHPSSGIYSAMTNSDGTIKIVNGLPAKDEKYSSFDHPEVNQPNLVIAKLGLKAGHSATFKVEKLTSTDAVDTSFEPFTVTLIGKGEDTEVFAKVKLQDPGRYKVTETAWSWGYTPTTRNNWAAQKSGTDTRVAFKESVTHNPATDDPACYIIRNVSHDTEEMMGTASTVNGVTHENLGVKFPFTNTYSTTLPATKFSEGSIVNIFYTPTTSANSNPGTGGDSGNGEESGAGEGTGDPD